MLQKITELWPGLLRRGGLDTDEEEEPLVSRDDGDEEAQNNLGVDEEQINQDYRHLYWTRLMLITKYECHEERKWPLGPDIIEECQAVANLPDMDQDTWCPGFEPNEFNAAHGPLQIDKYRLTNDELEEWAVRAIKIRQKIVDQAK